MDEEKELPQTDRALSRHILPTSGTMIGVCATLIGLVKVAEGHSGPSRVDEVTSLVALLFLASALTSYLSMRYRKRERLCQKLERIADQSFVIGICSIVAISMFFAYEII